MANSGNVADSNRSQFFITYAKQPHLDGKHTVFGKVIDGADSTLDSMERVPVNNKNRPLNEMKLTHARRCLFAALYLYLSILLYLGYNPFESYCRRSIGRQTIRWTENPLHLVPQIMDICQLVACVILHILSPSIKSCYV
jgi:Cyclophilin type peptidyl-prolyl cis-trans isomerase/CLD